MGGPHLFHHTPPCPQRTYISVAVPKPASPLSCPRLHLRRRARISAAVPAPTSPPPCLRLCLHSPCRDGARHAHALLVIAARLLLRTGSPSSPLSPALPPWPCSSSRVATLANSLSDSAFPLYPCQDLVVPHCAQYTHLFIGVLLGSKMFFYLLPNCLLQ